MPEPIPSSRLVGLDLLRLVAVLLVLGAHFREFPTAGEAWFRAWNRGGWIGVDLFFVLSGFLV
jgi:peptidoglycan/LPS O-acetylase OafA/YrhL